MNRRKVLFFAEDATLAQVVRLKVLAEGLDPERYDVHFACRQFSDLIFKNCRFTQWRVYSESPETVLATTESGARPYSEASLLKYIEDDLRVIDAVKPDLVVGDLRLSLCISAPHRKIPVASLINAYWSPRAERRGFPLPDHPMVDLLGPRMAGLFFPLARPFVFRYFAAPVNKLRRRFGLPSIGSLPEVLTHGTHVLFPDSPLLTPLRAQSNREVFLGPVLWSPSLPLPAWWKTLSSDVPIVYLTLGSSGRHRILDPVVEALASLPVQTVISTAGHPAPQVPSPCVHWAPYLPGDEVCRRAALVVCNGGATTAYQALAAGKPVVGIPSNLDQYLCMRAIEAFGAGRALRTSGIAALRATIEAVLVCETTRRRAHDLKEDFALRQAQNVFSAFVESV